MILHFHELGNIYGVTVRDSDEETLDMGGGRSQGKVDGNSGVPGLSWVERRISGNGDFTWRNMDVVEVLHAATHPRVRWKLDKRDK